MAAPTKPAAPWTVEEDAILTEADFFDWKDTGDYRYSRAISSSCECCSDYDVYHLTKNDDGTYHVDYWPAHGSTDSHKFATLVEAMEWC